MTSNLPDKKILEGCLGISRILCGIIYVISRISLYLAKSKKNLLEHLDKS